ncbi:hypothetical protein STTU_0098 [Streptomyces sp. Tu6071]|nr:hypothetical protein STTU_0098 [Streptomyces sp. Tu6071]
MREVKVPLPRSELPCPGDHFVRTGSRTGSQRITDRFRRAVKIPCTKFLRGMSPWPGYAR